MLLSDPDENMTIHHGPSNKQIPECGESKAEFDPSDNSHMSEFDIGHAECKPSDNLQISKFDTECYRSSTQIPKYGDGRCDPYDNSKKCYTGEDKRSKIENDCNPVIINSSIPGYCNVRESNWSKFAKGPASWSDDAKRTLGIVSVVVMSMFLVGVITWLGIKNYEAKPEHEPERDLHHVPEGRFQDYFAR